MAPALRDVIREVLERKQISAQAISIYLKQCRSLPRYDSAFKVLWALCAKEKISPVSASIEQIASQLVKLSAVSPAQARNAYSAVLLIPGFDQLRFCTMLGPCKRTWNQSQPRYATFWSAKAPLLLLAQQPLDQNSVILVWRLLHLA